MSRATELRDEIAAEIDARLGGGTPVDVVLYPDYKREELDAGPRVIVRRGLRSVEIDQGPDIRQVVIEVGVVGLLKASEGESPTVTTRRAQELAESDSFDDLLESIIAFWSPNGPLQSCGIAEHQFVSLDEVQSLDTRKLYESGVHLSLIALTYEDSADE